MYVVVTKGSKLVSDRHKNKADCYLCDKLAQFQLQTFEHTKKLSLSLVLIQTATAGRSLSRFAWQIMMRNWVTVETSGSDV
jgi:hypothetical protein